ncbi:MAG: DUF805 domain-containing protein [Thermoguttaceae bacterium]|nr:DUF805 domain-containing protein [Thermoguttaceae bacterium]MBR4104102.1 DUF805 domain-containing protein [Thermoguttaceae bacterium]
MREEEKTDAPRSDGAARIFDVRGRSNRSDWWEVAAPSLLAFGFPATVGYVCALEGERAIGWALGAFGVAFLCGCVGFFAILATSVRRLHDAGFSGRWLQWAFFPVVGWAVLAVLLLFWPGTKGENRYGAQSEERIFSERPRRKRKSIFAPVFAIIPNVFPLEDVLTGAVADETASVASTDPNRRVSRSEYGRNLGQTGFWLTVAAILTGGFIWDAKFCLELGGWVGLLLAAVAALGSLGGLFGLAFLAPGRLRDVGYAGERWYLLLIPVVGWATLVRLLTAPGTPGPNRFGPRPLSVAELKAAEVAEKEAKREEKRRAESGDSSDGTLGDSGSDDDREEERKDAETAADEENGDGDTLGSGFGDGFWSFFSSFGGDGDSDGGWWDGDCDDGGGDD